MSKQTYDDLGFTALQRAVKDCEKEKVQQLLRDGAFVNAKRKSVTTELFVGNDIALEIVVNKLYNHNRGVSILSEEEINDYGQILQLLIDYGTNRAPIAKNYRKVQEFTNLKVQLGISDYDIALNHRRLYNQSIVDNCASGDENLKIIYHNFYKFLMSRFSAELEAVRVGSTDLLRVSIDSVSSLVVIALGMVGGPVSIISGIAEQYFTSNKRAQLKIKAAYFVNNKHVDDVASDFCARKTQYYKGEILVEDYDFSFIESVTSRVADATEQLRQRVKKKIAKIAEIAPEDLEPQHYQKIILPHWEKIATRCILEFFQFLATSQLDYNNHLGEVAASGSIRGFNALKELYIEDKIGFSLVNAYSLGALSDLAYESKTKIAETLKNWGYGSYQVRQHNFHKSVIFYDDEKLIIVFRGTHHDIEWLRDAHIAQQEFTVQENKIVVHKGFYNAFMSHWDTVGEDYVALKSQVVDYLTEHGESKIYITGHSLGGAMASICYLAMLNLTIDGQAIPADRLCLYTYGQPKWFSSSSLQQVEGLFADNYYRIVNYLDPVPYLPPDLPKLSYKHCGEMYYLHKNSRVLDFTEFEEYRSTLDTEGNRQISDNFFSLLLSVGQHFMYRYLEHLKNNIHRENTINFLAGERMVHAGAGAGAGAGAAIQMDSTWFKSPELNAPPHKSQSKPNDFRSTTSLKFHPSKVVGLTDIHKLALEGDLDALNAFLEQNLGINLDAKDVYNRTALTIALQHGLDQISELLISTGANYDAVISPRQQNTLCYAAFRALERTVAILYNKDELAIGKDILGHDALYYAVESSNVSNTTLLTKYAQELGLDLNKRYYDFTDTTILWKAAAVGDLEVFKILLSYKLNADFADSYGTTILQRAIQGKNWYVVQLLLINDVSWEIEDFIALDTANNTILHICCEHHNLDYLYFKVIDKLRSDETWASIHDKLKLLAIHNKKIKILEDLLRYDGSLNNTELAKLVDDTQLKTLCKIHSFVEWNLQVDEVLFAPDLNKINDNNNTILYELVAKVTSDEQAYKHKISFIKQLIEEFKADPNFTARENQWTPLHLAISSGQFDIAKYLLVQGANPYQCDIHGVTPIDLAVLNAYESFINDSETIDLIVKDLPNFLSAPGISYLSSKAKQIFYFDQISRSTKQPYTQEYCNEKYVFLKMTLRSIPSLSPQQFEQILPLDDVQNDTEPDSSGKIEEELQLSCESQDNSTLDCMGDTSTILP